MNKITEFNNNLKNKHKKGGENMMDGFTSYEGNAVMWCVYHNRGTTYVHATSEAIALQRFMAKYPGYTVSKIERR